MFGAYLETRDQLSNHGAVPALNSIVRIRRNCLQSPALLLCLALMQTAGCVNPSAILVSYEIEVEVAKTAGTPAATDRANEKTVTSVVRPISGEPFEGTVFRDALVEAKLTAVRGGFEMLLTNLGRSETCFRFDE